MKKTLKTAMFAFAVVAAGLSGYKAYNAYQVSNMSETELLLAENLSALSEKVENGTVYVVLQKKKCWRYDSTGETRSLTDANGNTRTQTKYESREHYVAKQCGFVDYKVAYDYALCKENTARTCDQISASTKPLSPKETWVDD